MTEPMLVRYVARAIGAPPDLTKLLLARTKASYGTSYGVRALLFVMATFRPLALVIPRSLRARAIAAFVMPMLGSSPTGLAYVSGREAHAREPCDGMLDP